MKKYFLPLLLVFFALSCSDDIETNTPGIQAQTDFGYFHTFDTQVYTNDDGTFTIQALDGSKTLNLTLTSLTAGSTYELGGQSPNVATYIGKNGVLYSTDSLGDGTIRIKTTDENGVYGSFSFNARVNGVTGDTLNFSQGAFFGVPMSDGDLGDIDVPDLPDGISAECGAAFMDYQVTFSAFVQAVMDDESSEVLQEKCAAAKQAIEVVMSVCDLDEIDPDGVMQMHYDFFGDCTGNFDDIWDDLDWDF